MYATATGQLATDRDIDTPTFLQHPPAWTALTAWLTVGAGLAGERSPCPAVMTGRQLAVKTAEFGQ
ncbi:hypothetical protein ACFV6E_17585 [Streptomyces sp. NPDC059785]|uniref:hypothetical protein n=1 Tax=Streptomyces sp. NPDC059785 TaxID=3346945 RepID=UPI00365A4A8F